MQDIIAKLTAKDDKYACAMLGSNKLLAEEQTAKLNLWVDIIQEALMWLLDDAPEEAFWSYKMYLEEEKKHIIKVPFRNCGSV